MVTTTRADIPADTEIILLKAQTTVTVPYQASNVMLELGSTAHPYEPYTGGAPSPSPDYPQEIHSVEELHITVTDAEDETVSSRTITPPFALNKIGDYKDVCDVEAGVWRHVIIEDDLSSHTWTTNSGSWIGAYCNHWEGILVAPLYDRLLADALCEKYHLDTITHIADGLASVNSFAVAATGLVLVQTGSTSILPSGAFYYVAKQPTTQPIAAADLEYLRSLSVLPTDHHITITDQDGNDVSYLVEYIVKLSEVTP